MNLIPPAIHLSGDRTKAIILKAKALALYNFLGQGLVNSGLPFLNKSVVFADGSTVEVRIKKESNYNNYSGTLSLYAVPIVPIPLKRLGGVFVTYLDEFSGENTIYPNPFLSPYSSYKHRRVYNRELSSLSYINKEQYYAGQDYWVSSDDSLCVSWLNDTIYINGMFVTTILNNIICVSAIGNNKFVVVTIAENQLSLIVKVYSYIADLGEITFLFEISSFSFDTHIPSRVISKGFFLTDAKTLYILSEDSIATGASQKLIKYVFNIDYLSNTSDITLDYTFVILTDTLEVTGSTNTFSNTRSSSLSAIGPTIHRIFNNKDNIDIVLYTNPSRVISESESGSYSPESGGLSDAFISDEYSYSYEFYRYIEDSLVTYGVTFNNSLSISSSANGSVDLSFNYTAFVGASLDSFFKKPIFTDLSKNIIVYLEETESYSVPVAPAVFTDIDSINTESGTTLRSSKIIVDNSIVLTELVTDSSSSSGVSGIRLVQPPSEEFGSGNATFTEERKLFEGITSPYCYDNFNFIVHYDPSNFTAKTIVSNISLAAYNIIEPRINTPLSVTKLIT